MKLQPAKYRIVRGAFSRDSLRGGLRRLSRGGAFASVLTPVLILAVLLPLMAVLFAGCGSGLVGRAAPGFVATTLDGAKVSLGEYKGKPVVLAFMASW
jgi:hypothetical protein